MKPNGDGEIRTHDPLLARQVLSQLSYTPVFLSLYSTCCSLSSLKYWCYQLIYIMKCSRIFFFLIWQPPTFPCRLQHSIIGRSSLNRRVRDVNGCFPRTHRHQKLFLVILDNQTVKQPLLFLLERRWSSRTFRYGYLVTTSPQSSAPPSAAPSFRLGHWLRAYPTPMVWRAVCTRPGNVFTATFWFAITSDSSFM